MKVIIKMYIKIMRCKDVDRIQMVRDKVQLQRVLMNTVIKLRFPHMSDFF